MLKRPLYPLDVVWGLPNIEHCVLGVFYTETHFRPFVPTLPSALLFFEVASPDTDSNLLVIKQPPIKFKKVDQMFA